MGNDDAEHLVNLQRLCRVCGEQRSRGRPFQCRPLEEQIKKLHGVDVSDDKSDVHPSYLCGTCNGNITNPDTKSNVKVVQWKGHDDDDDCWVCDIASAIRQENTRVQKSATKRRRSDTRSSAAAKLVKEEGVKLVDINEFVVCTLCSGYLIDAATVTECRHSFCKSCLVKHLQTGQTCPTCKILINEPSPLSNISFDNQLQDLVNKLVPGLVQREERAKNDFYASRGLTVPQKGTSSRPITPQDAEPAKFPPDDGNTWFHEHDIKISLCIEPFLKEEGLQQLPMKYIRCSLNLKVEHLAKFIQQKIVLSEDLELVCNKKKLDGELTLENIWLDTWKVKEAPMRLFYNKKMS